jgi:hypothetical protein
VQPRPIVCSFFSSSDRDCCKSKKKNHVTRARLTTRLLSGDRARSRQRARPQTWSVLPRGLDHLAHVRGPWIKIQGTTYKPTWSRSFGINAPWIDQTRRDFCLAVCVALPRVTLVQSQCFFHYCLSSAGQARRRMMRTSLLLFHLHFVMMTSKLLQRRSPMMKSELDLSQELVQS